jgi:hypothetical protein
MNYNISKSKVEVYKLHQGNSGDYWADITIDPNAKGGRIQIASDFGEWQYYWGAAGSSFKKFLTGLNIDYVAGKFGVGKAFDFHGTIKSWKSDIIRNRRDMTLSAEKARTLFNEVKEVEMEADDSSSTPFQIYVRDNADEWLKFCDYCPDTVYRISPRFQKFWDTAWAAFVAELKKELEQELQKA